MKLIQTQRLKLIPLLYRQLILLSESRSQLEQSLALNPTYLELNAADSFMEEFSEALIHHLIPQVQQHEAQFEWYTHWIIIHRKLNLCIGGIGGTGLPDENGEIMIGYFIDKKHESQGYATEAVKTFAKALFSDKKTRAIIADTLQENRASQKVLQNNGFVLLGEVEEGLRWVLKS